MKAAGILATARQNLKRALAALRRNGASAANHVLQGHMGGVGFG